jgi:hypothetical protein
MLVIDIYAPQLVESPCRHLNVTDPPATATEKLALTRVTGKFNAPLMFVVVAVVVIALMRNHVAAVSVIVGESKLSSVYSNVYVADAPEPNVSPMVALNGAIDGSRLSDFCAPVVVAG